MTPAKREVASLHQMSSRRGYGPRRGWRDALGRCLILPSRQAEALSRQLGLTRQAAVATNARAVATAFLPKKGCRAVATGQRDRQNRVSGMALKPPGAASNRKNLSDMADAAAAALAGGDEASVEKLADAVSKEPDGVLARLL